MVARHRHPAARHPRRSPPRGSSTPTEDPALLAAAVAFLAAIGLAVGSFAISIASRSVAEPIAAVRQGDGAAWRRATSTPTCRVDDGSEVGLLEAGFNSMAAGLRERERMRDLFGRHVGREVAQAALERDGEVELGGELREVAVVFVDVIGSTRLALRRPPHEVVALLNRFFALVVEVVEQQCGWVNKFEGDAALCVFGAPTRAARTPPATRCAPRASSSERLDGRARRAPTAGIGVSAGPAVAGNVGAEERFEYTVIGDPGERGRAAVRAGQAPPRAPAGLRGRAAPGRRRGGSALGGARLGRAARARRRRRRVAAALAPWQDGAAVRLREPDGERCHQTCGGTPGGTAAPMPVNEAAKGKTYPPFEYEVGKEKIKEYAWAVGEDNPVYFDREQAKAAGFRDVAAPPMFAVVYSGGAVGAAPCSTRTSASTSR